jgi:hypothetical protein
MAFQVPYHLRSGAVGSRRILEMEQQPEFKTGPGRNYLNVNGLSRGVLQSRACLLACPVEWSAVVIAYDEYRVIVIVGSEMGLSLTDQGKRISFLVASDDIYVRQVDSLGLTETANVMWFGFTTLTDYNDSGQSSEALPFARKSALLGTHLAMLWLPVAHQLV